MSYVGQDHGSRQGTPSANLPSFHGPFFFGLDEMHLIGQNIAKQILSMICCEYTGIETPFCLPERARLRIGDMVIRVRSDLPIS